MTDKGRENNKTKGCGPVIDPDRSASGSRRMFSLLMDDEDRLALKYVSLDEGMSMAEIIRRLLGRYLALKGRKRWKGRMIKADDMTCTNCGKSEIP